MKKFRNDCQFKKEEKIYEFNNQNSARLTVRTSSKQFETICTNISRHSCRISPIFPNFYSSSLNKANNSSFFFLFFKRRNKKTSQHLYIRNLISRSNYKFMAYPFFLVPEIFCIIQIIRINFERERERKVIDFRK